MARQTPFRVGVCYGNLAASSGPGFRASSSRQKDEGTRRSGSACNNAHDPVEGAEPHPPLGGSGTGSFLLHYFSTNRVDSRGLRWIPVDSTAANKRLTSNMLDHKLRVVSQLPKHARTGSTPAAFTAIEPCSPSRIRLVGRKSRNPPRADLDWPTTRPHEWDTRTSASQIRCSTSAATRTRISPSSNSPRSRQRWVRHQVLSQESASMSLSPLGSCVALVSELVDIHVRNRG